MSFTSAIQTYPTWVSMATAIDEVSYAHVVRLYRKMVSVDDDLSIPDVVYIVKEDLAFDPNPHHVKIGIVDNRHAYLNVPPKLQMRDGWQHHARRMCKSIGKSYSRRSKWAARTRLLDNVQTMIKEVDGLGFADRTMENSNQIGVGRNMILVAITEQGKSNRSPSVLHYTALGHATWNTTTVSIYIIADAFKILQSQPAELERIRWKVRKLAASFFSVRSR